MKQVFLFLLLLIPIFGFSQQRTVNLNEEHFLLTPALAPFCDEYQVVYDVLTTKPSSVIASTQNTMVCGLVDDGVWAKLDVFYLYAQTINEDGEALKNWVNPGIFDATAYNAPTFTSLEGFTGNGSTAYIDCNWDPFNNGVNYTLDNANFGGYFRDNIDEDGIAMGTADSWGKRSWLKRRFGGSAESAVNCDLHDVGVNVDSRGMFIAARLDNTDNDLYRNKVKIIDTPKASSGLSPFDLYVLALNNSNSLEVPSTAQCSMAFAGGGLTQTDVNNMTDRFETYMDSNGKGVIP